MRSSIGITGISTFEIQVIIPGTHSIQLPSAVIQTLWINFGSYTQHDKLNQDSSLEPYAAKVASEDPTI